MKNNIGYIFVDDGYPDAEEYETNYIRFNMANPADCKRAAGDINNMKSGTRLSDTLVFREIPIDSSDKRRLPRSYRRHRRPKGISRLRTTLKRLLKD